MSFNPLNFGTPTLSRATSAIATNNTGSTIPKGTPVKITGSGLALIDVSVDSDVDAIAGVTLADIPNTSAGEIVSSGLVQNLTTAFNVGDSVYIGIGGSLINVRPDYGVSGFTSGDFVVKVGIISQNAVAPLNKDLLIEFETRGQL